MKIFFLFLASCISIASPVYLFAKYGLYSTLCGIFPKILLISSNSNLALSTSLAPARLLIPRFPQYKLVEAYKIGKFYNV